MIVPGSASALLLKSAAPTGYNVERSLRFNSSDSAYLSRTPSSSGNRRTWTWAGWVKRSALGANQALFEAGNGSVYTLIWFNSSDKLGILEDQGGGGLYFPYTAAVFRDTSAWYHIVVAVDTTQATSTNRIKIYVNGVQQTIDNSYPSQNLDTYVNSTNAHRIGYRVGNSAALSGYLADVHFIDGQALDPTSFTEVSATTGQLIPKAYSGSFGTNGFWLKFSDNSNNTATTLGKDYSGNGNNWTPNNFYVSNTVYSSGVSITGSYANNTNARMAFDGSISTKLEMSGSNNQITFTPPASISFSSTVEVYLTPTGNVTYTRYSFNGGADTAFSAGDGWKTVASGGGTFTSLVLKQGAQSNNIGFAAIRINGSTILVDASSADNDSLVDTPTSYGTDTGAGGEVRGNYCTLNPLASAGTMSNGNLDGYNAVNTTSHATFAMPSSGKWYFEGVMTSGNVLNLGLASYRPNGHIYSISNSVLYSSSGVKNVDGVNDVAYGASFTTGDVIGVACDADSSSVTFYKNGVSQGAITHQVAGLFPSFGNGGIAVNYTINFGQRPFAYDISTGISGATGAKPVLSTSDDYGQTLSSGTAPDSNSSSLVLALPMNGTNGGTTFTDYSATIKGSGSAKTVTVNGNAQTTTSTSYWYGSSGAFDASGDALTVPAGSDFAYGTGDFCVEMWINLQSQASGRIAYAQAVSGTNYFVIYITPTTNIVQFYATLSGGGTAISSAVGITNNSWNHIAVTRESGTVRVFINGTLQGSGTNTTNLTNTTYTPTIGAYNHDLANSLNGYIQDFRIYKGVAKYTASFTPPNNALYKALCDTNLPAPVVAQPSTVMDVKLWTGNGTSQTISGLGFSPDLVWIKARSSAVNHNVLDVIRGTNKRLFTDLTSAEDTDASVLTAFNSDGFSVGAGGASNGNGTTYVGWTWDAGSSTVTNTQGSITSQVRTNGYLSIVTYTGNGTNPSTVGHGLGVAPVFIIHKCRSTAVNWFVYHGSAGNGAFEGLNTTAAYSAASGAFGSTAPTSTVLTTGADTNTNGRTYVDYCFAPVSGYSSFGSYTGNGSTDGPFVFTGMRPRWLIIKRTNTTENWQLWDTSRDPYNSSDRTLFANLSTQESNPDIYYDIDILSNGFKLRNSHTGSNASASTYVYFAVAENPFQYARAR